MDPSGPVRSDEAPGSAGSDEAPVPDHVDEAQTRRLRDRFDHARLGVESAKRRVEEAAPGIPALDAGFRSVRADRAVGGSLLAGAMGFRLFLWLVPAALVLVSGLGIATSTTTSDPTELAGKIGLSAYIVESISQTSTGASFFTLVVGLFALWLGGNAAFKTLRTIHLLAWRLPVTPARKAWKGGLWFTGACFGLLVLGVLLQRLRSGVPGLGLVVMLMFVLVYAGSWFAASLALPHADIPWTDLLPGALLFGIGVQVLHLVTVFYLIGRVDRASDVYGPLGAAIGLLLWLYLLGRLIVAAPVLNATLVAHGREDAEGRTTPGDDHRE